MNKKAISIMIGYVLLITAAVVMSLIVYSWVKTYIPKETPKCPEGVSLMIKSTECSGKTLNLQLKNNGLFSVDGYFIKATKSGKEIATVDLSGQSSGIADYPLEPNQEDSDVKVFLLPDEIGDVFSIEIIPIRTQTENNKKRFVTCGDAMIKGEVSCVENPAPAEPPPSGEENNGGRNGGAPSKSN